MYFSLAGLCYSFPFPSNCSLPREVEVISLIVMPDDQETKDLIFDHLQGIQLIFQTAKRNQIKSHVFEYKMY